MFVREYIHSAQGMYELEFIFGKVETCTLNSTASLSILFTSFRNCSFPISIQTIPANLFMYPSQKLKFYKKYHLLYRTLCADVWLCDVAMYV
jgi:hypothetical protein